MVGPGEHAMHAVFTIPRHRYHASAVLGLAVWVTALVFLQPEWAAALLLFGALVIVPLGLALLHDAEERGQVSVSRGGIVYFQIAAAACLTASFAMSAPGPIAAALSLPWLCFTLWIAAIGLLRLLQSSRLSLDACCLDAAMIFLAVGGVWTTASRYGARLMGFNEPIVLLTGAHFHFAGFALPLLTGLVGRNLQSVPARIAAAGVIAGVPLTAVGITVGSRLPLVEALTSWELAAACMLVAFLYFRLAIRPGPATFRLPLLVSGMSLLAGMGLAAAYALGVYTKQNWLDIPTMIRWHASINALGFALPGLLAWTLASVISGKENSPMQFLMRFLGQRPRLELWEARSIAEDVLAGPKPGDAHDVHERVVAQEAPGPPEPNGPFEHLAQAVRGYRVFPPWMLERVCRREPVQVGDTVGGCYHLLPGIDLMFAARVTAVCDDKNGSTRRAGFTYQTLDGHPELGEETFSVEKDESTGRVSAALRSWSRPGAWLTRIAYPYARRCQLRAGRAALDHLEELVQRAPVMPNQSTILTRSI
jgi:uncharacterized protein (UPF0548 family)